MRAWGRVLAAVALAATAGAATAQTIEFKSVTIVVGSSAGGGYDTYARVLARHIGRHVPGQPSVIVQNMPGASSRAWRSNVANWTAIAAPGAASQRTGSATRRSIPWSNLRGCRFPGFLPTFPS